MHHGERVNVLLVDDQPAKLLAYESVLGELGENLVKAGSAREALEILLKTEIAIILIDVCMPDLDGFQLAELIRGHPRFADTAIVFVSAVQLADADRVRGYQLGAVDYVPVPIVPEILRAKVKVFAELHRKTRQLEQLNAELERRVRDRTAALESANAHLRLAIETARLGSWAWDVESGEVTWSDGYAELIGYRAGEVAPSLAAHRARIHADDVEETEARLRRSSANGEPFHHLYRIVGTDGAIRWLDTRGQYQCDARGRPSRLIAVAMDVTVHKLAEERQDLMLRELHHRVKNTLATVQAIANLTARSAPSVKEFNTAFTSRLRALSRTHTMLVASNWRRVNLIDLVELEIRGFDDRRSDRFRVSGPPVELNSETALSVGLALHELMTNAAKYGSLSVPQGRVHLDWSLTDDTRAVEEAQPSRLELRWSEHDGPAVRTPTAKGFGSVLLRNLFAAQTGAEADMDFQPSGLRFRAVVPLAEPKVHAAG